MQTDLDSKIRDHILALAAGDLRLREFETWFVPAALSHAGEVGPTVEALICDVELILAEASAGHWSEPDACRMLVERVSAPFAG